MTYQIRKKIPCAICGVLEVVARRLCRPCYAKAWKNGGLDGHKILGPSDVFETRFKKTDTCWIWTGGRNNYGYGIFLMPGEIPVRAHRYSYEFYKGPIPAGKIIMHTCDNPPCVNPDHLRIGTKAENNADTGAKRRHNYGVKHWNGRLTDAQIASIRASTEPQRKLGVRYGVSQAYISRVKSGERRKS